MLRTPTIPFTWDRLKRLKAPEQVFGETSKYLQDRHQVPKFGRVKVNGREPVEYLGLISSELGEVINLLKESVDKNISYEKEIESLKAKVDELMARHNDERQRNESLRSRIDNDSKQARQAFDSLRSEHLELKDELEQAQEKMMEYKLKFDYAQKQLQSDS